LSNKLSSVILSMTVQSLFMISIVLIIYVDTVIFDHGVSERSLTEFTQEGLIFVSAIIFLLYRKTNLRAGDFWFFVEGSFPLC